MNFTQLSTFRILMKSESMSDAAVKLGRTQPAVSATIKALEEQIGFQLFERRGRQLIPAPEAQYLLAEADAILTQLSRVRETMKSLSVGQSGTLSVAAMPGPVSLIFPRFVASHLANTETISVSIQARTSFQIAELTRAQSIDFGFADAPESLGTETLYHAEIISGDCHIALPKNHPLTEKDKIDLADLDDVSLGTLPPSHAQSVALKSAFNANGLNFRQTFECQSFLPILHFVSAGQCCSMLDPLSVFLACGDDKLVDGIEIRSMTHPIRYEYALYSPLYRPVSVMAKSLLEAWRQEVLYLLEEIDAQPISSSHPLFEA